MKKIICLLLALVMCLGLCACGVTTTNDAGAEVPGVGRFIFIYELETSNERQYLAYDRETYIVYYADVQGESKYVAPYQIYQDGAIYGAVYENGQIVPKPYAMGITEEMVENYFNGIFG